MAGLAHAQIKLLYIIIVKHIDRENLNIKNSPLVPSKNVSQFGPAVWPVLADIKVCNVYTSTG